MQCLGLSVTEEDIEALCASLTKTAKDNAEDPEKVKTVTEKQLLQWGVLAEQDGQLVPINAYAILTGNTAVRSVVQCGVFKGTTKAVFVDRREFAGTPQELIEESYQYVLRNIHMGARFKGVYRQDVYEIPPDAIRELIVNAIVHRSYIDHSSIQIAIYDNRLEITSPGRLPMGQTIERMKQGYSKIRNEALASAFDTWVISSTGGVASCAFCRRCAMPDCLNRNSSAAIRICASTFIAMAQRQVLMTGL